MTTTRIEITARDNTAAAFGSVDKRLDNLSRGVSTVTSALGALGVGFSAISVGRAIIDATADMQRFNNALTVATGSTKAAAKEMSFIRDEADKLGLDLRTTTEQYSKLAAASRGTALEGQATRDIFSAVAQASTVMGLSAEQAGGALLAIQQIISKGTVSAEELRGQLGERLPGAFQIAARSIGVTTQELDKLLRTGSITAEQLLPALAIELNNTFGSEAEQAAQNLNAQMNRFNTAMFDLKVAIGELGLIEMFTAAVNAGTTLANVFATSIIPKVKEFAEFINSIPGVSTIISAAFGGGTSVLLKKFSDETKTASHAMREIEQVASFVPPVIQKATASNVALKKSINEASKAQHEMQREAERTADEIKRLTREYDPLFKRNEELGRLIELRKQGLPESIFNAAAASAINEYIAATSKVEEAIKDVDAAEKNLGVTTKDIFDDAGQYAIQAARSIQTTFANALADSFGDFKNFGSNILVIFKSLAANIASTNILRGIGFGSLIAGGSGSALAGTGSGVSALDLASLGTGALNLVNSGFGLNGLIGGGLQSLGGAIGSNSLFQFGAGLSGDLLGAGGAGSIAGGLGASLASFAGPAAIAAIADIGLRQLFGDKKLGGTAGDVLGYVPVIGTLINGLFGRGAPKFKQEDLLGSITSSGFSGVLNQSYKEKGSVFTGSRTSNFIVDTVTGQLLNQFGRLSESGNIPKGLSGAVTDPAVQRALEVGELLDTTFSQLGKSLQSTADILGLSKDALDGFNTQIDLVSEKGQAITQEQIGSEIARISDEMITSLIPSIHELGKQGEDSATTLARLGGQFQTLQSALQLFGADAETATAAIRNLSLEQQTSIVDQFGGIRNLSTELSDFYNNIFTDSQKLDFVKRQILDILKPLNIDFVPTLEQIYNAVSSGNPELVKAGFSIDGLVVEFNRLNGTLNSTQTAVTEVVNNVRDLSGVNSAFSALEKSVQAERNKLTEQYNIALRENNSEIQRITESLGKLNSLSNALQQTIETINPVGLNSARANIRAAIESARSGNVIDLQSVRSSLNALTSSDTSGFSSRVDFMRSQAQNAGLVREFSSVVDRQLDAAETSVDRLEDANRVLELGFNAEQSRLDSIIETARLQLDALNGIAKLLSVSDAQTAFNAAVNDAQFPYSTAGGAIRSDRPITVLGDDDPIPYTNNISRNQIRDFFATNPTPQQIYDAARQNNVNSGTIASALGVGQKQIDDFFAANPEIPRFASGTSFVPKTGPAIVHKGERIINPEQNKDLVDQLKKLVSEVTKSGDASKKLYDFLKPMTTDGQALKVQTV